MNRDRKPSPDDPVVIPLEDYKPEPKPLVCRMCFARRLEPNAPCPGCGFDERTGLTASTRVGKRPLGAAGLKCAKCGYDLQGLPSPRCPECGAVAAGMSKRDLYREQSKEITRQAYRTPILMFLIAGGLMTAAQLLLVGPAMAATYLLLFAIEVPIGVGVFLLCCLIWIGFDAPIHLTALRLAGIYAVVDLTWVFAGFVPLVGWLIPLGLYVALLSEMLEMELMDAVAVGLLTFAAKVFVGIALVMGLGLSI